MLPLRFMVAVLVFGAGIAAVKKPVFGKQPKTVCVNDCNGHGKCLQGLHSCECFAGYNGADCSRRNCPSGISWTDRAEALDTAHVKHECSNAGVCDPVAGTCKCFPGFSGQGCERIQCPNDCSGHGRCLTMREAASMYDGRNLEHRTTYVNWDADIVRGCVCDAGFDGYDCSQLTCLDGVHPFELNKQPERAFFHCACDGSSCGGSMKFRVNGHETQPIPLTSSPAQMLEILQTKRGLFPKVSHVESSGASICVTGSTITTAIIFAQTAGNIAPIDLIRNNIDYSATSMLTKFPLTCNCADCDGYFRLGFQGILTSGMRLNTSLASITEELEALPLLRQTVTEVTITGGEPTERLCEPGLNTTREILLFGRRGNLDKLSLSVSATDSLHTDILTIQSFDGEAERGPCNWVGRCDKQTGACSCPAGFTGDQDAGSCGLIVQTTSSDYLGQQQCPGLTSADGTFQRIVNKGSPFGYMSVNANESMPDSYFTTRELYPMNGSYIFKLPVLSNVRVDLPEYDIFYTFDDNATAGALALDLFHHALYVAHNTLPGILRIDPDSRLVQNFTITAAPVWGMTLHLPVADRKFLYWTVEGILGVRNGEVFRAELDLDGMPSNIESITELVDPIVTIDPRGVAVHYRRKELYWTDLDADTLEGVIYRVQIDNWSTVTRISLPQNVTNPNDVMVIGDDVYFVDGETNALYSFNVIQATSFNTTFTVRVSAAFQGADNAMRPLRDPQHLTFFEEQQTVWISEREREYLAVWALQTGKVEAAHSFYKLGMRPVDIVFYDTRTAYPPSTQYLDCNGHGTCHKSEIGFMCKCYDGFVGDCTTRTCPKGIPWFAEASGANIARTEAVECGMNGLCNVANATCTCPPGFYGSACQFRQCDGSGGCSNSGACLSMRELARQSRDMDGVPVPQVYGSDTAGSLAWDADRLFGCACDQYGFWTPEDRILDYIGPICSHRPCARTPDPVQSSKLPSNNSVFEAQSVLCDAAGGAFRLGFRGEYTDFLMIGIEPTQIKFALEQLSTIGAVQVEGNIDCSGSNLTIQFTSFFEDVPLLDVDESQLDGTIQVVETEKAVFIVHDCAWHGLCNPVDGTCSCFADWYGSNGLGSEGRLWDCGFTAPSTRQP